MVKIETTSISNLAVGNKNIDLLNIGNNVVYAGYSYPCVGEYNFNPITLQQYIDLPYIGDPQNVSVSLYFSKYIESFEYRIVSGDIDSGFKVCALNEQVSPVYYGIVINNGNYAILVCMCSPRYIVNETQRTALTEFKIDGKLYSYNIRS